MHQKQIEMQENAPKLPLLGLFCAFQSSFLSGWLNATKNLFGDKMGNLNLNSVGKQLRESLYAHRIFCIKAGFAGAVEVDHCNNLSLAQNGHDQF